MVEWKVGWFVVFFCILTSFYAPRPGEQGFTVAAVDGPDVPAPKPGTPPEKPGSEVPITPTAVEGVGDTGQTLASSGQKIPDNTINGNPGKPVAVGSAQPPAGALPAAPAATLKDAEKVLGNIERLRAKEKAGKLSLDEQRELAHSENVVALAQVANLEAEQQALRKLPQPRELDPAKAEALKKARAMLERPWPGGAEKPAGAGGKQGEATTTTQSSGGSQLPGATATTNGGAAATGHATGTQIGTGEDHGKSGRTTTASSGGTTTPATESGTYTTNGVAAPSVGHGNTIPENTTQAKHIDLARKRAENLEETARKRPLTEHERKIYDNARRVVDRNSPATPGSRKTGDPKDLVMAGGDGPATQTQGAAADTPPPAAPAQPANAVGTTIEGRGAGNPDGPTASTSSPSPPPSTSPPGSSTSPATASGSATTTAAGSISKSVSLNAGSNPSTSPPGISPAPSNSGTGNATSPSYPPIDHDHIIKADFNSSGKPTGGHSLVNGDVEIIAGIESWPNAHGVYEAHVHMKNSRGQWVTKESNQGVNTMFPKNWSAEKIKTEVEAAWNSPNKIISGDGKRWRSTSPSGVVMEGYINSNRITAYPVY